jgi:hypothetical protein
VSRYPAIPDFSDVASMQHTVRAMKEILEQLAGQRVGDSRGAPSVFVQDTAPSSLLDSTRKHGDLWITNSSPPTLYFWNGVRWVQVAP